MSINPKMRNATRYAFICIALMMLVFLLLVLVMLLPMGLNGYQQMWTVRILLYVLLGFALLGAALSLRVAWLQKKAGR